MLIQKMAALALVGLVVPAAGAEATKLGVMAKMPVKEVTIFKDGHAFVAQEGTMPVEAEGNVILDYLPSPVLGTFWPYSAEKDVKLSAVVAGQRRVSVERTALNLRDLLEANIGGDVVVTESPLSDKVAPVSYEATIVGWPTQSGEELEATSPPNTGEKLPAKGNVVLFNVGGGIKAVNFERIVDVTFKGERKTKLSNEEFRNLLTLKMGWPNGEARKEAKVGMVYLQKGLRWIPQYKVTIDGKGNAVVKLQATLLNELALSSTLGS